MRRIVHLLALFVLFGLSAGAGAQGHYPDRPVRLIMPFPTGGTMDALARVIGDEISKSWGQTVVVESRAGAAGSIGSQLVARSAPDGYTILFATQSTHGVNSILYKDTPYDPFRDFEPISMVGAAPLLLVVNPKLPVKTVTELVQYIRAQPAGLNYASTSIGGSPHIAAEMFKQAASLNLVHVPYKGSGPAKTDVIAGHVLMLFDNIGSSLPAVQAGQLRALAVTGPKRSVAAGDVPTMVESGFPDVVIDGWYAFFAPAGTPKPIIDKWHQETVRVLRLPHVASRIQALGVDIVASSPQELAVRMKSDMQRYETAIRKAGITVQ